ncbi:MAG: methylmalonyl Co-A mutase-associated GTPase MeaB [Paracoccaceae bacterium]
MEVSALSEAIVSGDRRALSRAITLVESTRTDHRARAAELLQALAGRGGDALRIGLTGTPGVGKSTFTDSFGTMLVAGGHSVAVLAVDPSSSVSGGSILGDKTRMPRLARAPGTFIRPSPARAELGGVARRTRDAIALCEAAGYDVILVETVGVGQSETMVAGMTDIFLLLIAPAGGDELQGVKRGIMEIADMIVVNKTDGELEPAALRTRADYAGALRLMRRRPQDPPGFPKAVTVSALNETGLREAWDDITALADWRRNKGILAARRQEQARAWFRHEVEQGLLATLRDDPAVAATMNELETAVAQGALSPEAAAARIVEKFKPAAS